MPGGGDRHELGLRNGGVQRPPPLDGDPHVLLTPQDEHRALDRPVQRLDLVRVARVGLRDLAVKARLPRLPQPRRDDPGQRIGGHRAVGRALHVGRYHRLVDIRREVTEDSFVPVDVPEKRRPPRRQRHGVDEGDLLEVAAAQQVGAQHGRPAEVVADDERRVEPPVVQQIGQQAVLRRERHVLIRALLGLTVAEQIVGVHGEPARQRRDDVPPVERRPRRAVHQHQRRAAPPDVVPDAPPGVGIRLREFPVRHIRPPAHDAQPRIATSPIVS